MADLVENPYLSDDEFKIVMIDILGIKPTETVLTMVGTK